MNEDRQRLADQFISPVLPTAYRLGKHMMLHQINTINGAAIYSILFHNSETVCSRIQGDSGAKTENAESNIKFQQNPYTAVVN